ncbi:MAG: hypothetical protein NVS2B12_03080 [Ktedonobacteraceae bacterium]
MPTSNGWQPSGVMMSTVHILILRPGAIGDTLLTFPILQYLHKRYAPAEVTFVGNANVLPLLRAFELAQSVADYEEPQWGQFFVPLAHPLSKQAARLQERVRGVDMAIFWLRASADLLAQNARVLGIQQVFVAAGRPAEDMHLHIVSYLAQSIGANVQPDSAWRPPPHYAWQPAPLSSRSARAVAIHPGSGGAQKCWPIASFAALIQHLWRRAIPVLLLAGPADHARMTELHSLLPAPPQSVLLDTLSDAPLLTVTRRLQECRAYIGNDSGITHLAALLGLPTLALFGPSNPDTWRPPGANVTVLHEPLLARLTVDAVQSQLYAIVQQ